ncbi:MAG: hypothetical protein EBT80_00180 [Chitinophagales bacterium]|nr:hypothetical protein [Chitinophagales bacterium]
MTNNNLYPQLSEPFAPEMERSITKSGTTLIYIPVSEVINRLNKVLGVDKWSFEVIKCERDAIDPDFVVAHVRINWWYSDGMGYITRDGIGGQRIKRTKAGQIVDLGDEFKGAISDALKKAAQTLGVGLYLARSEDAIEIEQVMDAQSAPVEQSPQQEASGAKWAAFMSISKKLTAEQKDELKRVWAEYSDNAPTPTASTATEEEIDFLAAEAIRIQFGGQAVE